ncbi:hypothetical protein BH23VER1_BH23VER1_36910 [soil metagenome]
MKLVPDNPIDFVLAVTGSVFGRVMTFFLCCWLGFFFGSLAWAGQVVADSGDSWWGGWLRVFETVPMLPLSWIVSLFFGFLNPWLVPYLLVYPAFAYLLIFTDRDQVMVGAVLVALQAIHTFVFLETFGIVGAFLLVVIAVGLVASGWFIRNWVWEAQMRHLDRLDWENEAKRLRKEEEDRAAAAKVVPR